MHDSTHELAAMKIQCFIFGLPSPSEEEEEDFAGYGATKFDEFKLLWRAKNFEVDRENTTCAGSEQADSPSGLYPLHDAVNLGDCDAVTQLLAEGASVSKRDLEGDIALHRAAYQSRPDLVNILLDARSDPNALDRKDKTPLRKAYD